MLLCVVSGQGLVFEVIGDAQFQWAPEAWPRQCFSQPCDSCLPCFLSFAVSCNFQHLYDCLLAFFLPWLKFSVCCISDRVFTNEHLMKAYSAFAHGGGWCGSTNISSNKRQVEDSCCRHQRNSNCHGYMNSNIRLNIRMIYDMASFAYVYMCVAAFASILV